MNINAGRNTVNLSLSKVKERPSFATVFDKLNARKLNRKNPLNAVLTQEQMFRYYLEETEPKLGEMPDNFDLEDTIGGQSLADMKLRDFAKLLSGDFEGNKPIPVYETLSAGVSYPSMIAPLITPPTLPPAPVIPTPPPPPPVIPAPAPAPAPAPSSSVATYIAAPVAVSGLMPTGTGSIPAAAPAAAPATVVSAPAPAPAPATALTISTAPASAGIATPPFSPTSYFASLTSGVSSAIGAVSSLVKPSVPSPSGASLPPSAVASGATTAVPTVAPTPTPVSGVSGALSPSAGAAAGAAAGGASAAEIASVAMTSAQMAGYKKREDIDAYINGLNEGLDPPERPATLKGAIDIENKDWVAYTISLITYNKMAKTPFKLTDKQLKIADNYEKALKTATDKNDLESIIENTIIIAQTPKPTGGAKSGKGSKGGK